MCKIWKQAYQMDMPTLVSVYYQEHLLDKMVNWIAPLSAEKVERGGQIPIKDALPPCLEHVQWWAKVLARQRREKMPRRLLSHFCWLASLPLYNNRLTSQHKWLNSLRGIFSLLWRVKNLDHHCTCAKYDMKVWKRSGLFSVGIKIKHDHLQLTQKKVPPSLSLSVSTRTRTQSLRYSLICPLSGESTSEKHLFPKEGGGERVGSHITS